MIYLTENGAFGSLADLPHDAHVSVWRIELVRLARAKEWAEACANTYW
jgi:hypothetical protein